MTYMIINALIWIVNALSVILFIYCILSWLPQNGIFGNVRKALGVIIEPVLKPIQKLLPPVGGIDFSPLVLMFLLQIIIRCIAGFF